MPIYEYQCNECNTFFEFLHKTYDDEASCTSCGSKNLKKQFSSFAVSSSEGKEPELPPCSAGGGMCNPGMCGMAEGH
jgi:putative FmdB family regulatory protein